jgi:hypothetical protein
MAGLQVRQSAIPGPISEGSFSGGIAGRLGQQVQLDFYTWAALAGAAFQVRAGTITTPLIGSVPNTNSQAEMCADAAGPANTIIPVRLGISVRLGTGTLHEYFAKSVATVSSAGAAFIPLPLKSNGPAAVTTARVAAAGVTVTAELATTTLRHWSYANPVAAGAGNDPGAVAEATNNWNPRVPPILVGPRCFYVQIAATTTGPSYYADFDFLEFLTAQIT